MENLETEENKDIWIIDTIWLSWKIIWSIMNANNWKNTEESRQIARDETLNFFNNVFKDLWINVEINFSNNSKENFENEVIALSEYIYTWTISDFNKKYISQLFLWNHTKWSTEAIWAYSIIPLDTSIQLKDILTYIPWIDSLKPIVFYRNKLDKETIKFRNNEIKNTINSWKRVLIFPEWTRIEWSKIWEFQTSLYKNAYNLVKDTKSSIITIITTDNSNVFPTTLEKNLVWMWTINKWTIKFTIDFIDAWVYEKIDDFNNKITAIIKWNVKKNSNF